MYSTSDLQKLVQMLAYLGIISPGSYPAHSVVIGAGANAAPGADGTLLASNGVSSDPSFRSLEFLGIQPALGYTAAHAGTNLDITSLASPAIGSATATTQARGTNNTKVATTAYVLRQSPFLNILDYGGDNTGVGDNVAAFNAAVAAAPAGQICIYFPAGVYAFANSCAYTFSTANPASITIIGAGSDATVLKFTAAGQPGIAIAINSTFNSFHIRDLTIAAAVAQGSQGLYVNQTTVPVPNPANSAWSDVTNVTFRGSDGYIQTFGWQTDVYVYQASYINFIGCKFAGPYPSTGVNLVGTVSDIACVFNFTNCDFSGTNNGLQYSQYVQGVTVQSCNFDGNQYGIFVPAAASGLDQLYVAGCQFNCPVAGIFMQSPCEATMIVGNFFLLNQSTLTGAGGVHLQNSAGFSIVGNSFSPTVIPGANQNGIVIESYLSQCGVITGNVFQQINLAINLQAASQHVNVQSNAFIGNGTNVLNSGTNNTIGGGSI